VQGLTAWDVDRLLRGPPGSAVTLEMLLPPPPKEEEEEEEAVIEAAAAANAEAAVATSALQNAAVAANAAANTAARASDGGRGLGRFVTLARVSGDRSAAAAATAAAAAAAHAAVAAALAAAALVGIVGVRVVRGAGELRRRRPSGDSIISMDPAAAVRPPPLFSSYPEPGPGTFGCVLR
jgi:hypothetical protein